MSDDDRKPPEQHKPSEPGALLEDLESIRALLDVDRELLKRAPTDDDIPILREVVRPAPGPTPEAEPAPRQEVQTDLFDARIFADRLLDESWQQQSNAILASARRTADALTAKLAPQASATARERLRSRLANELPPLLEQLVSEALDELQDRLLGALRHELARLTEAALTEPPEHKAPNDEPSQDD
ncbi:MAG: hypothetical protein JJT88_08645 [Gammaproteobacteria bacterium]|nr:hypothetical protein [Gammaproteobacteria bacterium]